jgi:ankyrin repeat protein
MNAFRNQLIVTTMNTHPFVNRFYHFTNLRLAAVILVMLTWSSLAFCGEFHDAAESGNLEKVKALIKENPGLASSKEDTWGKTPLHYAAMRGHKDVVELLLANGADVNAEDNFGETPLHCAADGNKDLVALLLSKGANVNATDRAGVTPLDIAASAGHKDVAELLIANKAEVNIHDAVDLGDLEKLKALLKENPYLVSRKDNNGETPLHLAALYGSREAAEVLLANNADVNAKDNYGRTPLQMMSNKEVADLLLANKADVNIHDAVRLGDLEKVKSLLKSTPELVASKDTQGCTPLHLAAGKGRKDMVELLLTNKADVNATDSGGDTPFHAATAKGSTSGIAILVIMSGKIDYDAKDSNVNTAEFLAVEKQYEDVVKLLLSNKADVNAKDYNGMTPLHFAAMRSQKGVVELLLANGADVNAKDNNNGMTPLERVLKMPSYRFSQATDHEANHANAQHRFTMIQSDFIVAAQSARFEEPAEGSFDNPAFGQNLESLGLIAAPHDVQFQFAIRAKLFDPSYQCPQVSAIGPEDLQPSKRLHQYFDQGLGCVPILRGGGGNHQSQNQSQAIHRQMAFAPFDLFARVVAALSGLVGRFDRLAVNNGRRRGHVAPFGVAHPIAQRVVDEGPGPILAPLAKIAIDGLPGAKVFGQKPPRAARSHHVKDGVDQSAAVVADGASAFAPAGLGCGHQRFDLVPFFIGQIRWITYRMRLHPFYL